MDVLFDQKNFFIILQVLQSTLQPAATPMTRFSLLAGCITVSMAWTHVLAFDVGSMSSMTASEGSVEINSDLREGSVDWTGVDDESLDSVSVSGSSSNDTESISFHAVLSQYKSYIVGLRFSTQSNNLCYGVLVAPKLVLAANCEQSYVIAKEVPWAPAQKGARVFAKNYAKIGLRSALTGSFKDGSETIRITSFWKYPDYYQYNSLRLTLYNSRKQARSPQSRCNKNFLICHQRLQ